ncbi:MAG: Lrp/AsnC ligand binding domain-containing protein [Thermoproteota archaeon]|nr:Lrp/AsnC ligand binding domain-containing protein [Thermoproteota archaeon]
MPIAYVLINCDLGSEGDIIKKIKQIPEVIDVTNVAGVYDIIVRISSDNMDKLRENIKLNIKKIDKVRSTITMIVTEGQGQKKITM